ncbi:MAG: DUF5690 family protein [Bacteroidia bacterium]|nr:DUF5690 family protein [Bacteroidia bacterium]
MPPSLPAIRRDHTAAWVAMSAAFITYCSMYAFRKPFTAGVYADLQLWGVDYKSILITAQVIGYMLSKFAGIQVVSEMPPGRRIRAILLLIGFSWISLLGFAVSPYPYHAIWMFLNGLPLGMIWGLVFSFLEGRRTTELLGAAMSVSFIVASGMVKAAGRYVSAGLGASEFWMPFLTGLLFVPPLLLGLWMLARIAPPSAEDMAQRTQRTPMDRKQRAAFFRTFAPGIVLMVAVYVALTIFRDLRDNFAVELWTLLGFAGSPQVLLTAELPIGAGVLIIIALMIYIRDNRIALYANLAIIAAGGGLLVLSTFLYQRQLLSPAAWMILAGFAMYLPYVSFHTMLFERWIALFRYQSNIGFLMYTADAFGYLGSVGVLFLRHFGGSGQNWLTYIGSIAYLTGAAAVLLTLAGWAYFRQRARELGLR